MPSPLQPHELQHSRLLCSSLSPTTCSNSCPLSWWCYLTISSSLAPFSFSIQSFPASGSFTMGRLFASGGSSFGTSASASVLPMHIQGWFLLRLTGLISLQSKGLSRVFSSTTVWKHQFFSSQLSIRFNSHICTWLLENHSFDYMDCCWRSDVSAFQYPSRFVIALLPRSKHLLISWLQSPSTVILEPRKINSVTASTFPLLLARKWWDWMPWSLFFECWVVSQLFHSHLSPSLRSSLVSLHFVPLEWYHLHIWCWYFSQKSCFQLILYSSQHFTWCTLHIS